MLVRQEKLKNFLEVKKLSKNQFADMRDVEASEVEKMLTAT